MDEALCQRHKGRLGLESGERRASAVMEPAAETEMADIGSIRVEPVRIAEHRRVAIAGGEEEHDVGALRDGGAGYVRSEEHTSELQSQR